MERNQERYFFISGVISFSFFLLILFLVGYSLVLTPKVEQFAMIKSDVINISIALSETPSVEESEPENVVAPEVQSVPQTQETPPQKIEEVPEVSDLFAKVKSEKIPPKKHEENRRQDQLNALEKEILQRKETPRFSEKVNQVALVKPSVKMVAQGGSTGPIVNEYHAKIQGLVYTYFRPPSDTAGQSARVRIVISPNGKLLGYRVLSYSGSSAFNTEVDWLKDRLNGVRFPEHPEGKEAVLEFILMAKEQ